ncbi:MAG: hypothetical protein E7358_00790 [Clostridiales bacterium]|nr:hypothetical protein [Clostridiales bacterium]
MKSVLKRVSVFAVSTLMIFSVLVFSACDSNKGNTEEIQSFYDAVVESKSALETLAGEIYTCWHAYVYKDKYSSVDAALLTAITNEYEAYEFIKANDEKLKDLYKTVKDSDLGDQIKDVMSAYTDYYEFVYNVSGSFTSFSSNNETLKKELASAVKKLELEM